MGRPERIRGPRTVDTETRVAHGSANVGSARLIANVWHPLTEPADHACQAAAFVARKTSREVYRRSLIQSEVDDLVSGSKQEGLGRS